MHLDTAELALKLADFLQNVKAQVRKGVEAAAKGKASPTPNAYTGIMRIQEDLAKFDLPLKTILERWQQKACNRSSNETWSLMMTLHAVADRCSHDEFDAGVEGSNQGRAGAPEDGSRYWIDVRAIRGGGTPGWVINLRRGR